MTKFSITEDYYNFSKYGTRDPVFALPNTVTYKLKLDASAFLVQAEEFQRSLSNEVFAHRTSPTVPVKLLTETAKMPTRGEAGSIGLDLYSDVIAGVRGDTIELRPQTRRLISTGVSMAIPAGYYGRIAPRSGLAFKNGIDVLAGVIDASYRGEINVLVQNNDLHKSLYITSHMRIAQIVFERADQLELQLVDELPASDRGANGFGSTGV